MVRSGELEVRLEREDTLMPGRKHVRFTPAGTACPYTGRRARQIDEKGLTVSIFGTVHEGVDISTDPGIDADRAAASSRRQRCRARRRPPAATDDPAARRRHVSARTRRASPPPTTSRCISSTHTPALVDRRSDAQADRQRRARRRRPRRAQEDQRELAGRHVHRIGPDAAAGHRDLRHARQPPAHPQLPERRREPEPRISPATPTTSGPTAPTSTPTSTPATPTTTTSSASDAAGSTTPTSGFAA